MGAPVLMPQGAQMRKVRKEKIYEVGENTDTRDHTQMQSLSLFSYEMNLILCNYSMCDLFFYITFKTMP